MLVRSGVLDLAAIIHISSFYHPMRRFSLVLPVLFASCATAALEPPSPDRARTHGTVTEAYSCAMRVVNDLGYTVGDADREARFLRVEQDRTGLMDALLAGVETVDQLTLTIFLHENGSTVLRVVTGGYETETGGENRGSRVSRAGSPEAWKDVQTILQSCGEPLPRAQVAPAR